MLLGDHRGALLEGRKPGRRRRGSQHLEPHRIERRHARARAELAARARRPPRSTRGARGARRRRRAERDRAARAGLQLVEVADDPHAAGSRTTFGRSVSALGSATQRGSNQRRAARRTLLALARDRAAVRHRLALAGRELAYRQVGEHRDRGQRPRTAGRGHLDVLERSGVRDAPAARSPCAAARRSTHRSRRARRDRGRGRGRMSPSSSAPTASPARDHGRTPRARTRAPAPCAPAS